MELRFSSAALSEVKFATEYYEAEVEGLGRAFLQKLRESISEIKKFPHASRIIREGFRRHLLSRFPYGVIYHIEGEVILVVAVMHLKRKPGYWEN